MNTAELIVELVLAGVLFLAALVAPAVAAGWRPGDLGADVLVPAAIAAGFMLGVIIDRLADSILERWERMERLAFAHDPRTERRRRALIGTKPFADPFPEEWMRHTLWAHASEARVKEYDRIRVRLRVARNMAVLTPALATSVAAALWLLAPEDGVVWPYLAALVPAAHLLGLRACQGIAGTMEGKPHTTGSSSLPDSEMNGWWSAGTVWIAGQVVLMFAMAASATGAARVGILASLVFGLLLTELALQAWRRIGKTHAAFLWAYCARDAREAFRAALTGVVHPPDQA